MNFSIWTWKWHWCHVFFFYMDLKMTLKPWLFLYGLENDIEAMNFSIWTWKWHWCHEFFYMDLKMTLMPWIFLYGLENDIEAMTFSIWTWKWHWCHEFFYMDLKIHDNFSLFFVYVVILRCGIQKVSFSLLVCSGVTVVYELLFEIYWLHPNSSVEIWMCVN